MPEFKYSNTDRSYVLVISGDKVVSVPRGHRLWTELGIDEAEATGGIKDADPQIDYSGS